MNRIDNTLPNPLPKAELPEVRNLTGSPAQYFQTVDPFNTVFHIIVLRVTYDMTRATEDGQLYKAHEQHPLTGEDRYTGEVGESSVLWESDYAPYKPKCDLLLLNATAYAPEQKPSKGWAVGISCAGHEKKCYVTGPRSMRRGLTGWRLSAPEEAISVPLSYEYAFGGSNRYPEQPDAQGEHQFESAYHNNPVGRGFARREWVARYAPDAYPAPQIEVADRPYKGEQDYPVAGFGPIGRAWLPRRELAGTYDEQWKAEVWPRLPIDHDYRYWNCAPEDQQIDYPTGGEIIGLLNLHAQYPRIRFRVPGHHYRSLIRLNAGPMMYKPFNLDTLGIDMASLQLHALYRVAVPADIDVRVLELHEEAAYEERS